MEVKCYEIDAAQLGERQQAHAYLREGARISGPTMAEISMRSTTACGSFRPRSFIWTRTRWRRQGRMRRRSYAGFGRGSSGRPAAACHTGKEKSQHGSD